ncbi:MAG: CpsD/CapB family tyrosine-protein kinase [Candidatus Binataceae bacterium]
MSRVYEALKKAESQRAGAELRIAEPASIGEASADSPPTNGISAPNGATAPVDLFKPDESYFGREPESSPLEHAVAPAADHRGPLLIVGKREYAAAAEHFHVFARTLQDWATRNEKRVFTITSALSGEGKSFISLNLAASLARLGNRVILVDADLRASSLDRAFNLVTMKGLIDYLNGAADLNECLHATPIPGLLLVPAGGAIRAPAEALGGQRMRDFVNEARAMAPAPYMIIDTPAASAVPDPQILSRLSDALVVVVAANRTPREMIKQTIENAAGATILGIALNRFEPPRSTVVHYPGKYALQK